MKEAWKTEENLQLFFFQVLLIDIEVDKSPPEALECESRPLIDLSNTPEFNKIIPLKPAFSEQVKVSCIHVLWRKK